jgi:hypothetical protein
MDLSSGGKYQQSPTQPINPPPPLSYMVASPLQYVHLVMHPGCRVPTPSDMRVDANVQIDRQTPAGASCFNDSVREHLEAAKEEVRCLTEANLKEEQDRARMDEEDGGRDEGNEGMKECMSML